MRGKRISGGCALAAGVLICCGQASAQLKMGALGDSLTDEYFEDGYGYAYNWVQHLVARGIDFGATAVAANQAGGTWGEPRRTGYRYNWARSGATSTTLLSQGQHTGLAGQAMSDGVTHAVLWVGANDFHFGPLGPYHAIYSQFWTSQQIQDHIDTAAANINAAITELRSAGLKVVLVNVPDYGFSPAVNVLYTSADGRQRVRNAIASLNVKLNAIASEHEVMLVNMFDLMEAIFGTHHFPIHTLLIGNVEINLQTADTSSNSRKWAGFVHDGVHPHTTLQGLGANVVITALNMGHSAQLSVMSEQEILSAAGLAYGGQNTLELAIGYYADYVVNYGCYANCDNSTTAPILNVDDFTCFIQKFAFNDPQANCDGSTTPPVLNVDDFICFIQKFGAGCP
jgi:hypothetical protein